MGSRKNVEAAVRAELLAGHSVLVDRTNIDERQRADWLLLARELRESIPIRTSLIVFDVPTSVCRARLAQRTNHPTIPTPEQAFRYVDAPHAAFSPSLTAALCGRRKRGRKDLIA